jgi:hypothetical protein
MELAVVACGQGSDTNAPSRDAVVVEREEIAMAIHAASAVPRTPWGKLRVQIGDPSLPTTVTGPARLIALFHWRRGKALPGIWIIEHSAVHTNPTVEDIDWALFPTLEAQREMMAHEERCARHVPRRSAPS